MLKVCKSYSSIVTLLLRFHFLALQVTCNVKDIDWIIGNWIVKGIEQFSLLYIVADETI